MGAPATGPCPRLSSTKIDLRKVFVFAPLDARAQSPRSVVVFGAHRASLAAVQARAIRIEAPPRIAVTTHERPLRRADALKEAPRNRKRTARDDFALDVAPTEILFVVVTFVVAIVDA